MPEGPEIRREARAIARAVAGQPLARLDYRVPALARAAARLRGARVAGATSRGKVLLVAFDAGLVQISHNQLYGKWRVMPARTLPGFETEHRRSIRVVIATAERAAVLLAATTLELVDARDVASHPLVARLGPDVLDRATTVALVRERYLSRPFARRAVATLLLDQRFLAGPGNYLRSEILHVAGVHPASRPDRLDADRLDRLARATLAVPRQSLATGGVTNDRALARELAARGVPFEERRFHVYGREGERCRTCGARIRRQDAGRAIFFCPRCQRR
jgi:endonuclease-8